MFSTQFGSTQSGAQGLVRCFRQWFLTFEVPRVLANDGGPEFTAELTSQLLKTPGVEHRVSLVYYPTVNGRAKVAVKTAKRLMRDHAGRSTTTSF